MPLDSLLFAFLLALALRWFARKAWRYRRGARYFEANKWRYGIREVE